jgi:nicotinate dehydrogenase subunit A
MSIDQPNQPNAEESTMFHLNRQPVHFTGSDTATLLSVLRGELALSGPKFGCGQGDCGACMVLVDGQPQPSCNLQVGAVRGRQITTVEGLGTPAQPHPLQSAFLEERAAQCGYCVAGIITSAAALLARDPTPDRDAIIGALEPHLCRCGAHTRMVRAVQRAAREMIDPPHPES